MEHYNFPTQASEWEQGGSTGATRLKYGLAATPKSGSTWDDSYKIWGVLINDYPELSTLIVNQKIIKWFHKHKDLLKRHSWNDQHLWFKEVRWDNFNDEQYIYILKSWATKELLSVCAWDKTWEHLHLIYIHSRLNVSLFKDTISTLLDENLKGHPQYRAVEDKKHLIEYYHFIEWALNDVQPPNNAWRILSKATYSNLTISYISNNIKIMEFIKTPNVVLSNSIALSLYYNLLERLNISFWSIPLNGIYKYKYVSYIHEILNDFHPLNLPFYGVLDFLNNEVTLEKTSGLDDLKWSDSDIYALEKVFEIAKKLNLNDRLKYKQLYFEFIKHVAYSKIDINTQPAQFINDWFPEYVEKITSLQCIAFVMCGTYIEDYNVDIQKYHEHINIIETGLTTMLELSEDISIKDAILDLEFTYTLCR